MSPSPSAIGVIRQFQSETDAITEAPQPQWARATVFTLAGLFVSIIAIMFLTKIDRVVTSVGRQAGFGRTGECFSVARSVDHQEHRCARGR